MIKTIILSMCLAVSSLSLNAQDRDERQYTEGPVTDVGFIRVDYGSFERYIDWLNSTWKPTLEATITRSSSSLTLQHHRISPIYFLLVTYKNMAALDKGVELEDVAKKVIGSTEVQNKARIGRNDYRKVLGDELIRELILK
jgi:hypothetical protein